MILRLAEAGNITPRDALFLATLCSRKEIARALDTQGVHELRDDTLTRLRDELLRRYPVEAN